MKHLKSGVAALAFFALTLTPLANTYADGPEDEEGLDYEYCQSANLSEVETYTVHFDTDGGTEIPDAVSVFNCSLREMGKIPANPEKEGNTFFGWYKTSEFNSWERWSTFGEIPDGDITLYALFIPNENVITSANINVDNPVAGTEVTVTYSTDQGAYIEEQNPRPTAVTNDTNYLISYAGWTANDNESSNFEGTFVEGEEYGVFLSLEANENFKFSRDVVVNVNGTPAKVVYSEYSAGDYIMATAALTAVKGETYTVQDESGNSVTFDEEAGHEYHLTVNQFSFSMTDEELEAADISREDYGSGKSAIIAAVNENGSVIAYFEFEIQDEDQNYIHEGPFNVKIKLTDEMKGYDNYKLMFVNIDDTTGEVTTEEAINLTLSDGYLIGIVPHFSGYVLLGSNNAGAPDSGFMTATNDSAKSTFASAAFIASILVSFFAIRKFLKKSEQE